MLNLVHLAAQRSFAHFTLWRPKSNGGWEFNYIDIAGFLTTRGYYLFRTSKQKHIFIRIIDNIVTEVGKKDLKDEILEFVKAEEPKHIYEFFLKGIGKCVNDEFLETLPSKQVEFKKDTKDAMQMYFQNCIVKITKDKISTFPYTSLNGYIWESQIIQREFDENAIPGSDFKTFCWNISKQDPERYKSICSSIGFSIHNYKNPAYCPAIIFNDEVISTNPEGGTGKGIIIKALDQCINILMIDGKTFSFEKSFLYQRVTDETRMICFQDVKQNFDFERCFSIITDGIVTEKKGKDELFIPFESSPKISITTNYAIKGSGNSNDRRRNELEITQFYNKKKTPYDEFGRMMFYEWNDNDWFQFYAFIAECCQFYIKNGIVAQELVNLPEKKLMAETSSEFLEFMEDYRPEGGSTINRVEFYERFKRENPTSKIASKTFYGYVRAYCSFHSIEIYEGKTNGIRYFSF